MRGLKVGGRASEPTPPSAGSYVYVVLMYRALHLLTRMARELTTSAGVEIVEILRVRGDVIDAQ